MYQRRSGKKNLFQKLQTIWRGPYQVTDIDKHGNLRLNIPGRQSKHPVFAADMLKHYHDNPEHLRNFETFSDSEDIQYTIKRITDHRTTKDGKQYLVHWKGYDEDENTWEPAKAIEKDAPEAVDDYQDVLAELGEEPMDMDSEQYFLCQIFIFTLKVICFVCQKDFIRRHRSKGLWFKRKPNVCIWLTILQW